MEDGGAGRDGLSTLVVATDPVSRIPEQVRRLAEAQQLQTRVVRAVTIERQPL